MRRRVEFMKASLQLSRTVNCCSLGIVLAAPTQTKRDWHVERSSVAKVAKPVGLPANASTNAGATGHSPSPV
jgi:hypothetical protein